MTYSIAFHVSFIGIIADPLAVLAGTRIGCWPNHTGQDAEKLADRLGEAGFHVYVYRYGTGNACHSGTPGNGVKHIDVVARPGYKWHAKWHATGDGGGHWVKERTRRRRPVARRAIA